MPDIERFSDPLCDDGHPPYPAHCVHVVFGTVNTTASSTKTPSSNKVRTFVAVARRADVAEEGFRQAFPGWAPRMTLSLAEVIDQVQKLRTIQRTPQPQHGLSTWQGVIATLRSLVERPFLVNGAPAVGTTETTATGIAPHITVMALSSHDAVRAASSGSTIAVPLRTLEKLQIRLHMVQTGETSAPYVWDNRYGGELTQHLDRCVDAWSPEQKATAQAHLNAYRPESVRSYPSAPYGSATSPEVSPEVATTATTGIDRLGQEALAFLALHGGPHLFEDIPLPYRPYVLHKICYLLKEGKHRDVEKAKTVLNQEPFETVVTFFGGDRRLNDDLDRHLKPLIPTTTPPMLQAPLDNLPDDRVCEEGCYPYPDDCVRVVVGVIDRAATTPSVMERVRTYVCVSTKDDLAVQGFKEQYPGFTPLVTLALDDVRHQIDQMHALREKTLNERTSVGRVIGKVVLPFEQPYLVSHRGAMGKWHKTLVMATSQINARKAVIPMPYAGMAVPLNLLEDLLDEMERVKMGDSKVPYLWDYSPGGDYHQFTERQLSPKQKEELKQRLQEIQQYKNDHPQEF